MKHPLIPHIQTILETGVAQQRFPGATLAWQREGEPLQHVSVGRYTYADDAPVVTHDTVYDQASLTKMVTATAVIRLLSTQTCAIDDEVQKFIPHSHATGVTIRHLLTHTSGLEVRLSTAAATGADALWSAVYATSPSWHPGSRVAYANVNSLLLGEIVAHVTGLPLADACRVLVLEPAGMHHTCFVPPASWHAQIPPSESDVVRGVIQGTVHDESCAALGGVAGHAGLFGTAADMVRFGMAWHATLIGESPWQIAVAHAQQALTNQSPSGQLGCGWGWMLERSFMGDAASHMAAHTGFTGPVVAIFPQHGVAWALMSNRTWPERTYPPQHHDCTAQVSNALYAWAQEGG